MIKQFTEHVQVKINPVFRAYSSFLVYFYFVQYRVCACECLRLVIC